MRTADLPEPLASALMGRNLIVFDGECVFCSSFFRFMLARDRAARFHYATAQSPLGQALYYQYPSDPNWYRFDPATGQHEVLGRFPDGLWSRDGRYRVQWMSLNTDEYRQFVEQRKIVPKISIWDSQTGLTRRYCIPESGISNSGSGFLWSPDNRYLSFTMTLPAEGDTWPVLYTPTPQDPTPTPQPRPTNIPLETQYEYQTVRTLVLDTLTGSVTIITDQGRDAIVWTGEAQ